MFIERVAEGSLPNGKTWIVVEAAGSGPVAYTTGPLGDYLAARLFEGEEIADTH